MLSADEKPGVQARSRIHPSRPPGPGRRPLRVESEYRRHGTLAYVAAYDVHRAHVIGHCAPSTGIEPFTALVDKVMTREPYSSAQRCFGSSTTAHHTAAGPQQHGSPMRFPTRP